MIPDTQVKKGVSLAHLSWIGQYLAEKRPDVIVHLGDHADMPSLSSYDKGKRQFEGRRYKADIEAAIEGMKLLTDPIRKVPDYHPRMILTLGNHEARITRAVDEDAKLEGLISLQDLKYEDFGWEVYPFLDPVKIDGIEYCHYFTSGVKGNPASSAAVMLRERMGSCVAGHVQKFDFAVHPKTGNFAMMAGIAYTHQEEYLGPQGNSCRQQIVMLHEVDNGRADPMFVSLAYLKRRFEK